MGNVHCFFYGSRLHELCANTFVGERRKFVLCASGVSGEYPNLEQAEKTLPRYRDRVAVCVVCVRAQFCLCFFSSGL